MSLNFFGMTRHEAREGHLQARGCKRMEEG